MPLLKRIDLEQRKRELRKKKNKIILKQCNRCLQVKEHIHFPKKKFTCRSCILNTKRQYADYIRESKEAIRRQEKMKEGNPCHRCDGYFPSYVLSIENGRVTCANCFLIIDHERETEAQNDLIEKKENNY